MIIGYCFEHLPGARIEHFDLSSGHHRPLRIGHDPVELCNVALGENQHNAQEQEQR